MVFAHDTTAALLLAVDLVNSAGLAQLRLAWSAPAWSAPTS